jgi:hypothetical protein
VVTIYVIVILGYSVLVGYELRVEPTALHSLDRLINFWEEWEI